MAWDIEDIKDKKKKLEELYYKETNPDKKYNLYQTIGQLNNSIMDMLIDYESVISLNKKNMIYSYESYNNAINESDALFKYFDVIDDLLVNNSFNDLPFVKPNKKSNTLNMDYIYDTVDGFYKSTNSSVYKNFLKDFNKRLTNLKIQKYIAKGEAGRCGTIYGLDESYITLIKTNDSDVILNMIHEYGHAYANRINPERLTVSNADRVCEFESLFMELIADDYLMDKINSDDVNTNRYARFYSMAANVNMLGYNKIAADIWVSKECASLHKIYPILKKIDVKPHYLRYCLNHQEVDNNKYILGYLIAIELYYMYKKDKEKALYYYNKFINLNNSQNHYVEICKDIELNEHSYDYSNNMILSIRKD